MELIVPKPGKYVVAVSGGVDSVSLLRMLYEQSGLELVVAHFDHGIRPDSVEDAAFVKKIAQSYGLLFETEAGGLGPTASEAVAREARYAFLRRVQEKYGADAIMTAHHQDDVIETAIINLLRGTHRKGLSSLASRPGLERPLLGASKRDIIDYAEQYGLEWRDDPSNQDTRYLRNYVRHKLMPGFSPASRAKFLEVISSATDMNRELDSLIAGLMPICEAPAMDRTWFNQLPHAVATEIMAAWLREQGVNSFDRKSLERLVVAAKTGKPGSQHNVIKDVNLRTSADQLALTRSER
jgi:tRNA(Ile)-lysidine synthase